jgi:son of sevenless
MVPLLRALSVLQNAVRTGRTTHFQPSTAYIISSVRALLTDVGCLARDAPVLKKHSQLARDRKRILSDLASLVSQAKRASEGDLMLEQKEQEAEGMIRGSGQLFAHVRGFLAVAMQCGINVQPSSQPQSSEYGSLGTDRWGSQEGTMVRALQPSKPTTDDLQTYCDRKDKPPDDNAVNPHQPGTPHTRARAKSLSDVRKNKALQEDSEIPPLPRATQLQSVGRVVGKQLVATQSKRLPGEPLTMHKGGQLSVSSVSSSSSVSSGESLGTPATPIFPSGPSTTAEVMETLRYTHDHYLSTIAAFIGHAHSHSRTSHASSTGHMYDLVREVVEMVCKLLTIVDAVLRHPEIPPLRAQDLRAAKEGLYNVTSTLADAVRQLTTAPLPDVSEEEERSTLLRSATNALKAGSDCVNAVKKCLQRPPSERPFIINLPGTGDMDAASFTPSKFSHNRQKSNNLKVTTGNNGSSALRELYRVNGLEGEEDEDLTIQAQTASFVDTPTRPDYALDNHPHSPFLTAMSPTTPIHPQSDQDNSSPTAVKGEGRSSLETNAEIEPSRPGSPVSLLPTDDGTTWDGSHEGRRSLEDKLRNGELPAVPEPALPPVPPPPPMSWLMSYDHASEDVAYNSDGQLVGATLTALVERMTPHDALVEPAFAAVFFLTFRQFTTPAELLEALIARYNLLPPSGLPQADMVMWQQRKGLPVRLRVANVVKTWLEGYWRPALDMEILPALTAFTRDALGMMFPVPSQRIMELIRQRVATDDTGRPKAERMRDAGLPLNPPSAPVGEIPAPKLHKTVYASLRGRNFKAITVTDFEPLELARQLTVMECNLYCVIQPEEVLETGQTGGVYPGNVKAVTSLSTVITGWVAESILNEPDTKKRTALVKFFIKVADVSLLCQIFPADFLIFYSNSDALLFRITALLARFSLLLILQPSQGCI